MNIHNFKTVKIDKIKNLNKNCLLQGSLLAIDVPVCRMIFHDGAVKTFPNYNVITLMLSSFHFMLFFFLMHLYFYKGSYFVFN